MLNTIVPIFSAGVAAGADFESIATVTVGSGGSSTITFSSIPGTYAHLQIRCTAFTSTLGANGALTFNSDTGTNYSAHQLYGNGSSVSAGGGYSSGSYIMTNQMSTSSSTNPSVAVIDILDYANSNKNTTVRVLTGFDANGSGYILLRSGAWYNTNAVTSLDLKLSSGNYGQYSHFALYGIKSA